MPLVPSTGLYKAVTTLSNISADMLVSIQSLFQGNMITPQTISAATYTHKTTDGSLIFNTSATHTLTLLSAVTFPGKLLIVRTIAAQLINSASSNVVPLVGGAASTSILAATAGKWAILQSDGTNWQIMASN